MSNVNQSGSDESSPPKSLLPSVVAGSGTVAHKFREYRSTPKDDHDRFSSRYGKESALYEMRMEAIEQITRDVKSVVRLKCGRAAFAEHR